jgi:DNA polymerase I-like protein with 3'-5' exonuclease and polymerase domains
MVDDRLFVIDATFLLNDAEMAFLGSALLVDSQGQNNSIVYCAVRNMLQLREVLGITQGIVLIGAEAIDVSSEPNIERFRECLLSLGTYVLHDPNIHVGALCSSINRDQIERWIVTRNKSLMQLINSRCGVILTSEGAAPDVFTVDTLATRFHICSQQVPSFLALTETGLTKSLTTKQAVRLLESGRTLDAIFNSPRTDPMSPNIERYLSANKAALIARLQDLTINTEQPRVIPISQLVRNDDDSRRTLRYFGFPSLGRLLNFPERVELIETIRDRNHSYIAIVDQAGLRELEEVVTRAGICSVDTESTDKDPRKASLLGVAIAVREGQAYYVPVTEANLHDISAASILDFLRGLLSRNIKIVGHNLKYDYVLLRRYGIRIADTYFDTMLAAHECFGDWDFFNLAAVAKKLIGKDVKRYRELIDEGQALLDVPFNDLVEHGCADADATLRLHVRLDSILRERGIEDQFAKKVMPLMRLLGDKECEGVQMDINAVTDQRDAIAGEAETLKSRIFEKAGKQFDVDSMKDVAAVLQGIDEFRERIGRQPLRQVQLEQLAQSSDLPRAIVQYGRIRKRVKHLEAICKGHKDGKVFPLFNQLKAPYGLISSADPRLFDPNVGLYAGAVLDKDIRQHIPDENRSLDILLSLTGDSAFEKDWRERKRDFIGGEGFPLAGIDNADVLISVAIGLSNAALCKRYLIDARMAMALRNHLTDRYSRLFEWLDEYRRNIVFSGVASSGTRRRYWEGLRSANIDKRNRALRSAVRWLIEM